MYISGGEIKHHTFENTSVLNALKYHIDIRDPIQ